MVRRMPRLVRRPAMTLLTLATCALISLIIGYAVHEAICACDPEEIDDAFPPRHVKLVGPSMRPYDWERDE
jgi:hypothetical protein